jgi:multiple sugar transport system ATP-binding protein
VILGIRPESFEDSAFAPGQPTIEVVVEVLEDLGSDAHVFFSVAARSITAEVLEAAASLEPGEAAGGLVPTGEALFTARVDARTAARVAERVRLSVDPHRLQFFDPETGVRVRPLAAASGAPSELAATL